MLTEMKQFVRYNLYAWGISLLITIIASICDSIDSLPDYLQPGIGTTTLLMKGLNIRNFCNDLSNLYGNQISEEPFSKFIFFHMPICIIITMNIVFFILIALKIRQIQESRMHETNDEISGNRQNLNNKREK